MDRSFRSRTRTRSRLACGALALGAAFGAPGCFGTDPYAPGEGLGIFRVNGTLVTTTCGTTPNPWAFDVRLRFEKNTLYWVQGGAPIAGSVDAAAHTSLTSTNVLDIRPADARTKTAACSMSRQDVVDVVLAPVTLPVDDLAGVTSFSGTLTYHFAPTEGSDCSDQVTDSGGDFTALPCDVRYTLAGERTGDAPGN